MFPNLQILGIFLTVAYMKPHESCTSKPLINP